MLKHIRKDNFNIILKQKSDTKGGISIHIYKSGDQSGYKSGADKGIAQNGTYFGLVNPGYLYIFNDNKWVQIDSPKLITTRRKFKDHLDLASEAMSIAITKVPIPGSSDKLLNQLVIDNDERNFISEIAYNMVLGLPISWLVEAEIYYIGDGKITATNTGNNMQEYSLKDKIPISPLSPGNIKDGNDGRLPLPSPPKLILSPSIRSDDSKDRVPRLVELKQIQSNNNKRVYDYSKSVQDNVKTLVENRAEWKRLNPNWADIEYKNRHEKHRIENTDDEDTIEEEESDVPATVLPDTLSEIVNSVPPTILSDVPATVLPDTLSETVNSVPPTILPDVPATVLPDSLTEENTAEDVELSLDM